MRSDSNVTRVGMVGCGNVGIAGVYAMLLRDVCQELVLVDVNKNRAEGEALDLMHTQGMVGSKKVSSGDYDDLQGCQVVVITAGLPQKPGESRLDLLAKNSKLFHGFVSELDRVVPDAIIVIASNPVDVLTHMFSSMSTRPKERVLGTGTMLDTSRLRSHLGEMYEVDPKSVHGYVLGEHGDSQVTAYSSCTIGGQKLRDCTILGTEYHEDKFEQLSEDVANAAYKIIDGKGYTNLAIGSVISELVATILSNKKRVVPVSVCLKGEYGISGVTMSLPTRVGRNGATGTIPIPLEPKEIAQLKKSANTMREQLTSVGF